MTKQTPIQLIEERVKQLENVAKHSDWFVGHWYQTFEKPLRDDVSELKIKISKLESDGYWNKFKYEQATKPKDKPSTAMIEAYWLSCFAWGLVGVAVTLAALRFGGVI